MGAKQKIIVREGDHLKLTCAASGVPKPIVTWRKKDGNAFPDGSWRSKPDSIALSLPSVLRAVSS